MAKAKEVISFRLPAQLMAEIERIAGRESRTRSNMVEMMLRDYVARDQAAHQPPPQPRKPKRK